MSFLTPPREVHDELLDEHDAPRHDMERSLRDLRRINRYLGGIGTYRRLVRHFEPVTSIADVGAATADLLESVAGPKLRVAIDFKIEHLAYRENGKRTRRVVADARQLPFRTGSIDVVTSAHFFHHFEPDENRAILRESLRVARRGVAVNDTQRHRAPLLFVSMLGAIRLVGRITRYDAPASIRRGYTLAEAREIARDVGASRWLVVQAHPFRFGILLWKK